MSVNPFAAASAYAAAARAANPAGATPAAPATLQDPGAFADLVRAAVDGVSASGQAAEAKAVALASGKADVIDLVTAVAETELAVETLVTVRDRVISAYQEILNMPI